MHTTRLSLGYARRSRSRASRRPCRRRALSDRSDGAPAPTASTDWLFPILESRCANFHRHRRSARYTRAAVFPSLAAISAEQVAAMLQQHPDEILIVGMDKDVTHVGELDAAQPRRHIPFLFYVIGKIEHTVQRFPSLAGILAAKQADR